MEILMRDDEGVSATMGDYIEILMRG